MSSIITAFLDTNFWIFINVILLVAIIGLIYHRYVSLKKSERDMHVENNAINLQPLVDYAKRLIDEGMGRNAIITSFNNNMAKLGAVRYREHTYREILSNNMLSLDKNTLNMLNELYLIYERARFSDNELLGEDFEKYLSLLYSLVAHTKTMRDISYA